MHTIQWHHPLQTKDEIRGGAPRCFQVSLAWQVQPSQVQTFANTASQPPPHPAWGGGGSHSLSIVMLGSSRRRNLGCHEQGSLDSGEAVRSRLISHRSGLCTLPRDHFTFLRLRAGYLFCSPVELLPLSNPTVALILQSKMGPWACFKDRSRETRLSRGAPEQTNLATAEMRDDSSPSPGIGVSTAPTGAEESE